MALQSFREQDRSRGRPSERDAPDGPEIIRAMSDPPRLCGHDIVCVGFADWDTELWTNQHHLMSRLARDNSVLFIESLGLRRPQIAGRDIKRVLRRLRRGLAPPRAVDGLHIPTKAMQEISTMIAEMDYEERSKLPCIGRDRADLVVAGCAILEAILEIWPAPSLGVADRGIREGILRSLMARDGHIL